MAISVKSLIDQYTQLQRVEENESPDSEFQLEGELATLESEQKTVLTALTMGVVIEKILNERRAERS
jgi:hypothetical protein